MSQTYDSLRNFFNRVYSNPTRTAENTLIKSGFQITDERTKTIVEPEEWNIDNYTRGQINDALDYLIEEWDYAIKYDETNSIVKEYVILHDDSDRKYSGISSLEEVRSTLVHLRKTEASKAFTIYAIIDESKL
jgi:hypothetical protein